MVAAGADRGVTLRSVTVWQKSAGVGMHHCRVMPRSPAARSMPSCQARGAAGRLAQAAHAEEALDQPVVLEGLDAPLQAWSSQRSYNAGVLGWARSPSTQQSNSSTYGDDGREVAAVRREWWVAEALAQRGDAVGQDVVARLPLHQPDGGTTHSSVSNGRSVAWG